MIITLVKADFSANNIGSLDSWMVNRALGAGATYDGPNMVTKDSALSATITLAEGYSVADAGVAITMGGVVVEGAAAINGQVITITIAEVTGNLLINVPTKSDDGVLDDVINAGLILTQGYASAGSMGVLENRVRTDYLPGSYQITLNDGYAIRMGIAYDSNTSTKGTALMETSTTTTTMKVTNPDKYSILTLTYYGDNSDNNISPSEDIVASIVYLDNAQYEDLEIPTLSQGYWLATGHNNSQANRVKMAAIQGPVLIMCNSGYVIRGVCEGSDEALTTNLNDIVGNAALSVYEYSGSNWIGVTFCSSESTNSISPTEDIVKSVQKVIYTQ